IERLARCFQLVHATPPRSFLVDRTNTATNDPAPSLRPDYRGFTTTTSRSACVPGNGTQSLTASGRSGGSLSPRLPAETCPGPPSPVTHDGRRPGSLRLHAGHRLANKRAPARLIPGSP